jgi:hypothetical protein
MQRQTSVIILSRVCGDYIRHGYWIVNWIYWITHSYNYSVYTLQFTIAAATINA